MDIPIPTTPPIVTQRVAHVVSSQPLEGRVISRDEYNHHQSYWETYRKTTGCHLIIIPSSWMLIDAFYEKTWFPAQCHGTVVVQVSDHLFQAVYQLPMIRTEHTTGMRYFIDTPNLSPYTRPVNRFFSCCT